MNHKKIPSILIVDDNPADVYLARHHLKAAEICDKITVCSDGQEAFDFLTNCKQQAEQSDDPESIFPSMILLDINMPRLDGFGFLKKIAESGLNHARGRPLTIVMLSTSDFSGDVLRAKEYQQVGAYITKPLQETHAPLLLELHEQQSSSAHQR